MSQIPFELELLTNASRYQSWLVSVASPFLGNRILEIGAGIGNQSRHLPVRERLLVTEPDEQLLPFLKKNVLANAKVEVLHVPAQRQLRELVGSENVDTIISFNVLEHVQDDAATIRELLAILRESKAPGPKRLVTLVPAHPFAFGEVDKGFGHHRRYTARTFRNVLAAAGVANPPGESYSYRYINLVGLIGWWLNGRLLRRRSLGSLMVHGFEALYPLIRPFDDLLLGTLRFPFGNTLLAVYELPAGRG